MKWLLTWDNCQLILIELYVRWRKIMWSMRENIAKNATYYYYYILYTLNCTIAAKAQRLIIKDWYDQPRLWMRLNFNSSVQIVEAVDRKCLLYWGALKLHIIKHIQQVYHVLIPGDFKDFWEITIIDDAKLNNNIRKIHHCRNIITYFGHIA